MIKYSTLALLTFILVTNFIGCKLHKNEDKVLNGFVNIQNETFKKLVINGSGNLDEIKVTEILTVNGNLQANNSTFNLLKINGKAELTNSKVKDKITINGMLNTKNSILQDIEASSTFISLINSEAQNITIKDTKKEQYLIEITDSIVHKNILFEGGNGQVKLKGKSKIIGNIKGGQITKEN